MFERRLSFLYMAICAGLVIIAARMFQLQVLNMTPEDPDAVLRRPLPLEEIPALRGPILDRNGEQLAYDQPTLCLAIQYRELLLMSVLSGDPPTPGEARMLRRYIQGRLKAAAADSERGPLQLVLRLLAAPPSTEDLNAARAILKRRLDDLSFATGRDHEAVLREVESAVRRVRSVRKLLPRVQELYEESVPHVIMTDVSTEAAIRMGCDPLRYPGVEVQTRNARVYCRKGFAPHAIGYLGAAEPPQRGEVPDDPSVRPGDRVGVTGAEKQFDRVLHGAPGIINEETDPKGGFLKQHVLFPAQPGFRVYLTLSVAAQQRAEAGLTGKRGAVVVMDVRNGELLVLASAPGFDNADVAASRRESDADPQWRPFLSRAVQDSVPSGSMIKPIVALAAAACGVGPERTFSCVGKPRGTLEVAGRVFRCDGEHGAVNMERAVSQSCNLYFWEVSRRIGPEAIFTWARDLGFGRLTGVDLPYEWKGRLPDPSRAPRWYVGNTLNLAVGQENLSVTPLQVAVVMAAIANGGKVIRPTVLHRIEPEPDPETFPSPCSPVIAELPLPPAGLRAVRAGMLDAALSGTASRVEGIRSLRAAVKTGTAQTTNEQINQAWIGGYLPADAPRYAFVVVVHNVPGHGADVAGPIAVAVLNTLLRDRPSLAP